MNFLTHVTANSVALCPPHTYYSELSAPWLYARSPIPSVCRTPGAFFARNL